MENSNTGTTYNGQVYYMPPQKPRHKTSHVLGIVAIVSLWFTAGLSGVVCGIIGIVSARRNKHTHDTTSGFVLCLVSLIFGAIILILVVFFLLFMFIFAPDSIGAYYIRDMFEQVINRLG